MNSSNNKWLKVWETTQWQIKTNSKTIKLPNSSDWMEYKYSLSSILVNQMIEEFDSNCQAIGPIINLANLSTKLLITFSLNRNDSLLLQPFSNITLFYRNNYLEYVLKVKIKGIYSRLTDKVEMDTALNFSCEVWKLYFICFYRNFCICLFVSSPSIKPSFWTFLKTAMIPFLDSYPSLMMSS